MKKILRILGRRGRITIPYELREQVGFRHNDVLSFAIQSDDAIVVKREKLCDNCSGKANAGAVDSRMTLLDFLDSLTLEQQREAVLHLSAKWAGHSNVIPFGRVGS